MASLACITPQRKAAEFAWGETAAKIRSRELGRLGVPPRSEYSAPNGLTVIVYADQFVGANCLLSYWLDTDSLQFVSYSCSNPDWDEEELRRRVTAKLSGLYGEGQTTRIGPRQYRQFSAGNGFVYFTMNRITQDRDLWRTFQANIFFAHYGHTDYANLRDVLSMYGR